MTYKGKWMPRVKKHKWIAAQRAGSSNVQGKKTTTQGCSKGTTELMRRCSSEKESVEETNSKKSLQNKYLLIFKKTFPIFWLYSWLILNRTHPVHVYQKMGFESIKIDKKIITNPNYILYVNSYNHSEQHSMKTNTKNLFSYWIQSLEENWIQLV